MRCIAGRKGLFGHVACFAVYPVMLAEIPPARGGDPFERTRTIRPMRPKADRTRFPSFGM
jgi:hypothetical protein